VLIETHSGRRTVTPLAAPMQMLRQTRTCVGIEITKRMTRVAVAKVLTPTSQIGVELAHQLGQRHMAVVYSSQLMHPSMRAL